MELESLLRSPDVLAAAIGAVVLAIVIFVVAYRYRRTTRYRIGRLMKAVAIESVTNVLLPDGMDGQIHLDYLLLTSKGILVLDIKDVAGVIFGSDKMDDWAVINGQKRFSFRNPLGPLYDRVAAVRIIASEVPVSGRVVFTPNGEFTKGVPSDVAMMDELAEEFAKPDKGELDKVVGAFYPDWEKIRGETVSA